MDRRKMLPHKPPGAIPKPSGSQLPEVTREIPMPPVKPPALTKTLRDEFAMAALSGLLANSGGPVQSNAMCGWNYCNCTIDNVAKEVYMLADAMLKARESK